MIKFSLYSLISPFAERGEEAREHRKLLRDTIKEGAVLTFPYIVMNALAAIVACYGLLSDSAAVVIGAMIIALLLGPIAGVALALVDGNGTLLRSALFTEAAGVVLVLAISVLIGSIHSDIPITNELLARAHPNIMDLIIALAGGAAGAYATISPRVSAGLVGVAVATALLPPLASCGILLAQGHISLSAGAFLLFLVNFVAIQVSSSIVLWLHGFNGLIYLRKDSEKKKLALLQNGLSLFILVILTVIMGLNFSHYFSRQRFQTDVEKTLETELRNYQGAYLADTRFDSNDESMRVTAVVRAPYFFTPSDVKDLEKKLPPYEEQKAELHVLSVIVKEAASNGYLYSKSAEERAEKPRALAIIKGEDEEKKATEAVETKNIQIFGH